MSILYDWATLGRNHFYDVGCLRRCRSSVPVVSVGNLTLGGTGKTPCVEHIARFYRDHGRRVAILSRGYGSRQGPNDEALVLHDNLPDVPHLQGKDRVALAEQAQREHDSDLLVLDDGFQHRRLERDLDIVLVDATAPWGHGYVFPRGLLRERPHGLSRAHLVMLTRCDLAEKSVRGRLREAIAQFAPNVPIVETSHRPVELVGLNGERRPIDSMKSQPVVAFAGLGNPAAFRQTLVQLGYDLRAFRSFPDHHAYTRTDVEDLENWARRHAAECVALTTQKDLVKLRELMEPSLGERRGVSPTWALRIQFHCELGQEQFERVLEKVMIH